MKSIQVSTQRLKLAPWTQDLAEDFFELSLDPGFTLFPITPYRQQSIESAQEWIKKNTGKCAVFEIQTGELIGLGGLTHWQFNDESLVDITYRLRESAWGRGLGLELAEALLKYGFEELNYELITATITPDNLASKRIAAKLSFVFDQRIILLGVSTDLYRLSRANYLK